MDFLASEIKFWETESTKNSETAKRDHRCFKIVNHFKSIINNLNNEMEAIQSWDDKDISDNLNMRMHPERNALNLYWIYSAHGFTKIFLDLLETRGNSCAETFITLVTTGSLKTIQNADDIIGAVSGHEYLMQDSKILSRRKSEKHSINQLRDNLEASSTKLFKEISEYQNRFHEWEKENREKSEGEIHNQKNLGSQQIIDQDKKFEEQLRQWSNTITALENTYEAKLRLDKPAQYWSKAAIRYNRQGWKWVIAIVFLVTVALINFQDFFVHWLKGNELELKLTSFQGVILFGTIVATYAFVLRVFSRLAFSSFHLMRDAQEREQLTYLYLSLTNESAIDKESRDIVLQALFSRSETGLLAQEHGPTMPGIESLKPIVSK